MRIQPDEGHRAPLHDEGAGAADHPARRRDGLPLRLGVRLEHARGVRAAPARRDARRGHALHAARRGRGAVGVHRSRLRRVARGGERAAAALRRPARGAPSRPTISSRATGGAGGSREQPLGAAAPREHGDRARSRRSCATSGPRRRAPATAPKTRACTMNLVVVAGDARDRRALHHRRRRGHARASPRARSSSRSSPTPPATRSTADATAVCASRAAQNRCSERVRLVAIGDVCARVGERGRGAARAGDPDDARVARHACTSTTRSSSSLAEGRAAHRHSTPNTRRSRACSQLARWARESRRARPNLADLAWTRLAPWQELCARFFDEPSLRSARELGDAASRSSRRPTRARASAPRARSCSAGSRRGSAGRRRASAARCASSAPTAARVALELGTVPRPASVAPAALAERHDRSRGIGHRAQAARSSASSGAALADATPDADVLLWQLDGLGQADDRAARAPRREQRRAQCSSARCTVRRTIPRSPSPWRSPRTPSKTGLTSLHMTTKSFPVS